MSEISIVELDAEDYEQLPTHKLYVHLLAGAAAGTMEHCVMYPIDSVKTRLQSLCPCPEKTCRTPVHGLISMVRREGIWRPFKGVNAIASGAVPAHALYFTVYEKLKHYLTGGHPGHSNAFYYAVSGCAATVFHDAVMNPAEVIKQRMQMCGSPFKRTVDCAKCIFAQEGVCAFYRSYATQLLLNVPFQSVHFVTYEFCQHVLNPKHKYDAKSHMISGALAGGFAAAVTTPLDVVKTVLNTQQGPSECQPMKSAHCPVTFRGISDAALSIYRCRGVPGFFSGLQARTMFQMPSTAISWTVYELFKYLLSEQKQQEKSYLLPTKIVTPVQTKSTYLESMVLQ